MSVKCLWLWRKSDLNTEHNYLCSLRWKRSEWPSPSFLTKVPPLLPQSCSDSRGEWVGLRALECRWILPTPPRLSWEKSLSGPHGERRIISSLYWFFCWSDTARRTKRCVLLGQKKYLWLNWLAWNITYDRSHNLITWKLCVVSSLISIRASYLVKPRPLKRFDHFPRRCRHLQKWQNLQLNRLKLNIS